METLEYYIREGIENECTISFICDSEVKEDVFKICLVNSYCLVCEELRINRYRVTISAK